MNTPRVNQGFTLIELMIVIAIVAILVVLAVPAYRDFNIRTKVTECVVSASNPKLTISEFHQTVTPSAWPANADAAAVSPPNGSSQFYTSFGNYVASTGSFEIDVDENAIGSFLTPIQPRLTPTAEASDTVSWRCSLGSTAAAAVKLLPSICRGPNP